MPVRRSSGRTAWKPESNIVRAPAPPRQLLQTFWYGDQIHWGKQRTELSVIKADPFWEATWEISARQAASDLSFFYLGFAVLLESLLP